MGMCLHFENLHLRVKPANRRLNNADSLVVDLARVDLAGGALEHGGEVQAQVLGVHLGRERVGEGLLLAGGDADAVLLRGEVLEHLGLVGLGGERAADDQDLDGLGLLVVDIEDGAGRVAVDELHAEDLCLREGGGDVDVEVGSLLLEGVFDCLFDAFDLFDLGVGVSGRRLMFGVDGDDVHTLMLSASWATAPKIWHAARAMDVSLKETIFAFETVSLLLVGCVTQREVGRLDQSYKFSKLSSARA
jgi:hypothetical protein